MSLSTAVTSTLLCTDCSLHAPLTSRHATVIAVIVAPLRHRPELLRCRELVRPVSSKVQSFRTKLGEPIKPLILYQLYFAEEVWAPQPVGLAWSFCDSGATAFVSNDY